METYFGQNRMVEEDNCDAKSRQKLIIRNERVALANDGFIKTRKLFGFDVLIAPNVLTDC